MLNTKLVDFGEYCPKCKFFELDDDEDPCNDCLACGGREGTVKPLYFEKMDKKLKKKKQKMGENSAENG